MSSIKWARVVLAVVTALFGLLYGASPIDVIPDFIPLLGWLDDLMVLGTTGFAAALLAFSAFVTLEQKGRALGPAPVRIGKDAIKVDYEPISVEAIKAL